MSTTQKPLRVLGAQFPAPWHQPQFRYFAPVDGGEGATPTDPPAGLPAPEGADAPPAADTAAPPTDTPPWGDDFDPERAWKRIQAQKSDLEKLRAKKDPDVNALRAEAAQEAREEAYREFGKHLGVVKDDEAPTVESLTETLQQRDTALSTSNSTNIQLRTENAVLRFADKHGADAGTLLDSRGFTEKLTGLDSTADTYASEVESLIKATVESDSRYRKVQVAPRSGNGDPAPSGGDTTPKDDIESLRATYRDSRGGA